MSWVLKSLFSVSGCAVSGCAGRVPAVPAGEPLIGESVPLLADEPPAPAPELLGAPGPAVVVSASLQSVTPGAYWISQVKPAVTVLLCSALSPRVVPVVAKVQAIR